MLTILIALALLAAGVGAIYLLLKNMTEEGIDIAAPGSCRRGQCGTKCRPPAEEVENAPVQIAHNEGQRQKTS
jgi:hypothetical protein